jgi:hypothetical protein
MYAYACNFLTIYFEGEKKSLVENNGMTVRECPFPFLFPLQHYTYSCYPYFKNEK